MVQAEIRMPDRKPLQVFVNHLKSNFITDEFKLSPAEIDAEKKAILDRRTRQADAVAAFLRRQRLTRRTVVLGDLNDQPDSPALTALTDAGLAEQVQKATTIAGPTKTGKLVEDRFAAESPSM